MDGVCRRGRNGVPLAIECTKKRKAAGEAGWILCDEGNYPTNRRSSNRSSNSIPQCENHYLYNISALYFYIKGRRAVEGH